MVAKLREYSLPWPPHADHSSPPPASPLPQDMFGRVIAAVGSVLLPASSGAASSARAMSGLPRSFFDLSATTLENEPFPFSDLEGRVTLVVNVASR